MPALIQLRLYSTVGQSHQTNKPQFIAVSIELIPMQSRPYSGEHCAQLNGSAGWAGLSVKASNNIKAETRHNNWKATPK